jgi:MYXO-CTERM domain-containing protein
MRRLCAFVLCGVLSLALSSLLTSRAFAQSPGGESGGAVASLSEIDALEKELDEALASLSTVECAIACQALESMSRAAERICVLEEGPRCEAARAKVADANRRVREACPECLAASPEEGQKRATTSKKEAPDAMEQPMDDDASRAPGAAPESVDTHGGGCAACTVGRGGHDHDERAALLLLLGALAAVARRRKR